MTPRREYLQLDHTRGLLIWRAILAPAEPKTWWERLMAAMDRVFLP